MRLLLCTAALCALAVSSPIVAQELIAHEATSGPSPIDSTTQTDDVAFRSDGHDRMTVPVLVAGKGPYRFLVDTGADRTAVSREVAAGLRLQGGPSANLHSVSGAELVATAQVPLLELSRKRVESIEAPVLERRDMGADGILGMDSLRSQTVLFDFRAKTLSIVPAEAYVPRHPDEIVVRAKARKGHLILAEAKANAKPVDVVVDTGAEVSIGNDSLRRRLGIEFTKNSEEVALLSVSGQSVKGRYGVIRTLNIGGATIRDLPVVFTEAHTFRKLKLDRKPTLLLGMNGMKAFDRVSIDFAARKFRVVLPQTSGLNGTAFASRARR